MNADDAKRVTAADAESGESPRRSTGTAAPAAAWAFAFLILRLFAVSGYDWNTAFAVSTTLSVNDGLSLLFGSLMAGHLLVAVFLMVVLPLLIATYLWSPRGHRPVVVLSATVGLVALVALAVSFHSWWLPLATSAVLGAFALIRRLPRRGHLHRASTAAMARVGWLAGVAVLLVAALVQTPWVPQEQIATTNGTITGYVLSVDSGYLNVLTDEHEFVILNRSDVLSRN